MSHGGSSSRAINEEITQESRLLHRLANCLYYVPVSGGKALLQKLYSRLVPRKFSAYEGALEESEFVFSQHTGAVAVTACFLLAIERGTLVDNDDSSFYREVMEPVRRLYMVSGGRPNIHMRVSFQEGNNNPSYGFIDSNNSSHKEHEKYAGPLRATPPPLPSQDDHIMSLGPPEKKHHVILHDPLVIDRLYPGHLLISARAFPNQPLEGVHHHTELDDMTRKAVIYCGITVCGRSHDGITNIRRHIILDPLPFIAYIVMRGPSIA
uniref:Wsv198-like protein n=1 Tax=Trachysalambria curvirostris nimavirus TaxID=2984282 RepID=A0A9C7C6X3_9VIRU|nr:MAG: wsv198-like protein [Trachysalambria curvirostris nimavirus]